MDGVIFSSLTGIVMKIADLVFFLFYHDLIGFFKYK